MDTVIEKSTAVTQEAEKDMRGSMTSASVFALLTGIPLFMTNKYFNITLSKFIYFAVISVLCFVLFYTLRPENEIKKKNTANRSMDIAVFGFLASSIVSVLLSSYKADALFGSSGRCMGLCFVLILTGLYYALSRSYKIHKWELFGYCTAFAVVAVIAFLQFFGINFGGLYTSLSKETVETFYSTVGNINVVSSYICLCLPFIMYLFCTAKGFIKTTGLYLFSLVGFCFLVIANSDSGYIGMAAAFCAIAYIVAKRQGAFYRVLLLAGTFLFSLRLMSVVYTSLEGKTKPLSELALFLGESDIILAGAVLLILAAIVMSFFRLNSTFSKIIRIGVTVFALLSVIGVTGAIIYFTVVDTNTQLGFLENYLRFSDKWATERGEIWKMTMESYIDLPFVKKLFGCGPDTLLLLLSEKHNDRMLVSGYVDNAHNEFMNYLVNHGLVGLGFYITVILTALRKSSLKSGNSIIHGGLFAVVISYACQSVVNITQPLTTPLFFILMFMCCCEYEASSKKKDKISEELKKL